MAYSVLQSVSVSNTVSSNTLALAYSTANLTSGTKLLAAIAFAGTSTQHVISVKDGAGNTFTQVVEQALSTNGYTYLFAIDTPAGDVGTKPTITATWTVGQNITDKAMLLQEVSGLAVGNTLAAMIDGTAGSNGGTGGSSTGSPTYSSTAAGEYLVSVYGDDGGPETWTKPTGTTSDTHSINSNSANDLAVAWKDSTNGTEAGSWALTGTSADWGTILCAFKAAAVAAAVRPPARLMNQAVKRSAYY